MEHNYNIFLYQQSALQFVYSAPHNPRQDELFMDEDEVLGTHELPCVDQLDFFLDSL